jgi:hypothetical protein
MNDAIDPARASALLLDALASTFADMAFIDVESAQAAAGVGIQAPARAPTAESVRVAIDVLKPLSWRLEIECPVSLKERIEATLFQGESSGAREGREDSLLEILNVAAGVFLTSYFGPGADIKLELPQYLFVSDGSEGEVLAEAAADAEGESLRVVLRSIRYRY